MTEAGKNAVPIIVKRIKKVSHGGHHGGAWKIAYADFVTAMMAFFLLMWLLGSTAKGDLKGISDYFNTPLLVALFGGSGSGDSSSVVQGGGQDLTRSTGQIKRGDAGPNNSIINLQAAPGELDFVEQLMLENKKKALESLIQASAKLKPYSEQIRIDFTDEGLRIQIVDEGNRPMFDSGKAVLREYFREILNELVTVLNDIDNRISVSGHTDSSSYASGNRGYSNWELSADRANAARRQLVIAGISEGKILRVNGLADSVPFDLNDPSGPSNRRISIVVLNKKSEDFVKSGGTRPKSVEESAQPSSPLNSTEKIILPNVHSVDNPKKTSENKYKSPKEHASRVDQRRFVETPQKIASNDSHK